MSLHSGRGPWPQLSRLSSALAGSLRPAHTLSPWAGGRGVCEDGKSAGALRTQNSHEQVHKRARQRSKRGWPWSQALDLAAMGRVWMGLSQEPGSHRGPGLSAQDPLPAPYIWRGLGLTAKPVLSPPHSEGGRCAAGRKALGLLLMHQRWPVGWGLLP